MRFTNGYYLQATFDVLYFILDFKLCFIKFLMYLFFVEKWLKKVNFVCITIIFLIVFLFPKICLLFFLKPKHKYFLVKIIHLWGGGEPARLYAYSCII